MGAKICIVGTGYVGMASAIGFAELGCRVAGYDVLRDRIDGLASGITPYHEEGIEPLLWRHLASGAIRFRSDFSQAAEGAEFVVLTVGTPSAHDGSADMSGFDAAVDAILAAPLPASAAVVVRSTVPVGTNDAVARRLSGRHATMYHPEFLREGSALTDFMNPQRIVIGMTDSGKAAAYASIFEPLRRPAVFVTLREAELIKAWSNAYLAMKISFANQVANFCELAGADADHVLRAVGYDDRIGELFLKPGLGFGGPCFEKDVRCLKHVANTLGHSEILLDAILDVNDRQPHRVVELLEAELGALNGLTVGVWGLAFKAGTSDVRYSLALRVLDDLSDRCVRVRAYDPLVKSLPKRYDFCEITASARDAACADALLVLTEWPEFAAMDPFDYQALLSRGVVVDGRNVLDPEHVGAAGLTYRGIGRGKFAPALELSKAG